MQDKNYSRLETSFKLPEISKPEISKENKKEISALENKISEKNIRCLTGWALSTALTGVGIYDNYLGYNTNNSDLSFLGMVLLVPGLIGISGLSRLAYYNFKKYKDKNK